MVLPQPLTSICFNLLCYQWFQWCTRYLINLNAFTLFATHFDELNALSMYPAVDFHHFETKQEEGGGSRYEFTHRIVDGQRKSKDHYGLDLARASLLPVRHSRIRIHRRSEFCS